MLVDNTTPETSNLPFHGYVWVENKAVIGNLTLIPLRKKEPGAYFIANVAVHPDHRGQGIGKLLTERAIQHVKEHNGSNVYLQVREDNDVAVHIYRELGFAEMSRRTLWSYRPGIQLIKKNPQRVMITGRDKADWPQQKQWLEALYPREISWNLPYQIDKFEPGLTKWLTRLVNGEVMRTWAIRKNSKLLGTVTLDHTSETYDYLWVASSILWEDEVIQAAVPVILRRNLLARRLAVNYPAGRARESFQLVGMQEVNTLIWMKYKIHSENEKIRI
jgi:GNAT superfamily N-acetyltransferase